MSAIQRLLDEVSWEGNAKKYRDGGLGLENVLTTEVLQALDFLPRSAFLGEILRGASGADDARAAAADDAERLVFDVLPGDMTNLDGLVRAQPDGLLSSERSFVFVEAKRIRRSSFQPEQLAREVLLTGHHAAGRRPLLLLLLGAPPPISVQGHGALSIAEAVTLGAELIAQRVGHPVEVPDPGQLVAFTTWSDIQTGVRAALAPYGLEDLSAAAAVRRVAQSLVEAVSTHR